MYVNPVTVEESPDKDLDQPSVPKLDSITTSSSLQNGEAPQKASPEVKGLTKTMPNQDIKYKRPPPRPPSLGSGSGMGLLFSSPSSPHTPSSLSSAAKKKEEGKVGLGEREERKSLSISPPPVRPPVLLQSRVAPPLPPAPLCRTSTRKSTDRDAGEGREREKGQNPAKREVEPDGEGEKGGDKTASNPGLLGEGADQQDSSQLQEEEAQKDRDKSVKDDEKQKKEAKNDKDEDQEKPSSQCSSSVKRPSRPVPPPRRKPCSSDPAVCPNKPAGGAATPSAGPRVPPPSPARRPDVSLYSPQGGAAIGADPDSCSTSSTEEEAELNQEQEHNHK